MNRRAIVLTAIIAVVVIAGGALTWWALSRPPSARDAAETYLTGLADGDVAAIAPVLPADADRDALESMFAEATGYLSDPTFDVVDGEGSAAVTAEAIFDGERVMFGFTVEDSTGSWLVAEDALGGLDVQTRRGDSAAVGGVVQPIDATIRVLPAVYTVAAAPTGILDDAAIVAAPPGTPVAVALEPSLTDAATALAQEQIDLYAAECASATDAVPPSCGIRIPWEADLATLDSVAFRIEATPAVELTADAETFAATGGAVVATVTGTTRGGDTASFTYQTDQWSIRGHVRFTGDEMRLLVG
ncbi:hypothetical protein ACFQZV_07090 [Microbacterium koreense]|uniref:DUF4878 domain-containing protein n=1 Tax=Microbacterium koreense TaxID=323761 RepID=A0ABW2ZRI8_9MICO